MCEVSHAVGFIKDIVVIQESWRVMMISIAQDVFRVVVIHLLREMLNRDV